MKNYVQHGVTLSFTAAEDVASGEGVLLGDEGLFGVSSTDVASGDVGEAQTEGLFEFTLAAVTPDIFDIAYWDDTNKVMTNVASGNTRVGYFANAAPVSGGACYVRLTP